MMLTSIHSLMMCGCDTIQCLSLTTSFTATSSMSNNSIELIRTSALAAQLHLQGE